MGTGYQYLKNAKWTSCWGVKREFSLLNAKIDLFKSCLCIKIHAYFICITLCTETNTDWQNSVLVLRINVTIEKAVTIQGLVFLWCFLRVLSALYVSLKNTILALNGTLTRSIFIRYQATLSGINLQGPWKSSKFQNIQFYSHFKIIVEYHEVMRATVSKEEAWPPSFW